jgi:drug/metabolite transporter (DMT)-like permease
VPAPSTRAGLLRLGALALLWSSNFLWIKLALRGFAPTEIVLIRLGLGALLLLPILRAAGNHLPRGTGIWAHLTVAAFFANALPYLLFAYGEQHVDSAIAGILNSTTPVWTIVLATAVGLEDRPTASKLVGVGVGFAGALVFFAPWSHRSQLLGRGGIACLLAAASYAVSYVYAARFLANRGLGSLTLSASQLIAATGLAALATALAGAPSIVRRPDATVAVIILGALGTGAAYLLNYRLILDHGPFAASTVIYLLPVVAVILGVALLGESLSLNVLAGGAIVLAGVALTRHQPRSLPSV